MHQRLGQTTGQNYNGQQNNNNVKEIESSMYCMTMIDLRRLAFDLVVRMNIVHSFDATSGLAGVDWARAFAGIRRSPLEHRLHLALHV